MSRQKTPAGATSEETARAAVRELHEAIQDARSVLAEIRAERARAEGIADGQAARMSALLTDASEAIAAELARTLDSIERLAGRVMDQQAELLGAADAPALIAIVTRGVGPVIADAAERAVKAQLPMIAEAVLRRYAKTPRKGDGINSLERLAVGIIAEHDANVAAFRAAVPPESH